MTTLRTLSPLLQPLSPLILPTQSSHPVASYILAQIIPLILEPRPVLFSLSLSTVIDCSAGTGFIRVLYNYAPGHFGFSRAFEDVFEARTGCRLHQYQGADGKWTSARTDPRVINLVLEKGVAWSSGADARLEVYTMDPMFQTTWSLCESFIPATGHVIEWIETGINKQLTKALFRHVSGPASGSVTGSASDGPLRHEVSMILEAGQRSLRRSVPATEL